MLSRIFRDDIENKQANRKKQIDTLKVFNDNVTELKEDVEYRVDFLSGETAMCLFVTLPPEFPNEKPHIIVQPPILHIWVNSNSEIEHAPGLLNFTAHSDLGRVVQVIIRDFQIRPPMVLGHNSKVSPEESLSPRPMPLLLATEDDLPSLSTLGREELEALRDDPERLEDFVSSLPRVRDLGRVLEARIAEMEGMAQENLGREEKLELLRKKVAKRVEQAQSLKASFDELSRQCEARSRQFQPECIREALHQAAVEADEHSEAAAERFLNGEVDVEHFLLEFIDKRTLSQTRKTKEEKLSNQLRELKRAGH